MRNLLAVVLILCCLPAVADDTVERGVLAKQLTELLEVEALYASLGKQCTPKPAEFSDSLLKTYGEMPDQFGGISPKSAYWAEVESIYREYFEQACATAGLEKLSVVYVAAYAQTMALADLRAAVVFYSSPAGKAMQAGTRKVFHDLQPVLLRHVEANERAANLIVQQSMLLLKNKFKAIPK